MQRKIIRELEFFWMSAIQTPNSTQAPIPSIDVDNIIERLLEVRGSRPGKNVQLTENEIKGLCYKAREVFLSQPNLLELEAPIKVCGDMYVILYTLCRNTRLSVMDNIMTFFVYLNTVDSHLRPITFSSVIMSTEASSH